MTSSRSARRARRDARRRPGPRTEPVPQLRTAAWDATTITFAGASDAGVPGGAYDVWGMDFGQEGGRGQSPASEQPAQDAEPAGRLRAQPRYRPPQQPPAGYTVDTGPQPACIPLPPAIGDALTHDDEWGPKFTPLPCGHCGTPPPIPAGILDRAHAIGHVNWLAWQAGWIRDTDLIRTCPACQQDKAWKARQGQLEVRLDGPPDAAESPQGTCWRHDLGHQDALCTCPAAVIAVDVMLTSWDYLNTGRAISIQYTEDAKAGRR